MNKLWIYIGSGGFLGSVARYYSQVYISRLFPSSFPLGTMTVNILGCFLIGIIYGFMEKGNLVSQEARFFLATGFCGGFTTFSAFSFESLKLFNDGEYISLLLYISLSVVIGILATFIGMFLAKGL